jgi:hypothetical protein
MMKSPAGVLQMLLSAAGAFIAGVLPAGAAAPPVVLSAANAASSVWDTDPTKVGVEVQVMNRGTAAAEDVRVTSVGVQGGALAAAHSALPIVLGNVAPQGSALLDLVITVPRTDGTAYVLTISGTFRTGGIRQRFSLRREVTPSTASPGPITAQRGVSATTSSGPAAPAAPHGAGVPPGFAGFNAATPVLIPPGPPRAGSPPNPSRPTTAR